MEKENTKSSQHESIQDSIDPTTLVFKPKPTSKDGSEGSEQPTPTEPPKGESKEE